MVVDTAAQSSVLMPALIQVLGLKPLGDTMKVNGAVGVAAAALYPIEDFSSDLFALKDVAMLALPSGATKRAQGIIGMDMFTKGKLSIDRVNSRVSLEASAPAAPGVVAIKGKVDEAGLLSVPLKVEGVEIQARRAASP